MEFSQLRSFLRVAEVGSITRAAEGLYLTQPAVTQHVRALERELGSRLFDRTGRGMQLTAAGVALRDHARRSLALLEDGRQLISEMEAGNAGRLILGAGVTTSIFHLPGWLRAYQESHPQVDVVVRTGRSREVISMALDREIDLGLITSPSDHAELVVTGLYEEEIVLVTPAGHQMAGRVLSVSELEHAPLILFSQGTGFRDYLDGSLSAIGVSPRVKMESDSVEAIKSFVIVGLGVSFLPAAAVREELENGSLCTALVDGFPPLQRRTAAIYRRDRTLSSATRGFLEVLGID